MTRTQTYMTLFPQVRRAVTALAIVAAAALAAPALSHASTIFGAPLTTDVQPSNAGTAHPCQPDPSQTCSWVMTDPYGPGQPHVLKAPKSGYIHKLKLIAGSAGSFRLQIVRINLAQNRADSKVKLVRNGPAINYQGQQQSNWDSDVYNLESFKVNVKVSKGDSLAIRAKQTSMLRCSSGGPNILFFQPSLSLGNPFKTATANDGCWLLLEAVM